MEEEQRIVEGQQHRHQHQHRHQLHQQVEASAPPSGIISSAAADDDDSSPHHHHSQRERLLLQSIFLLLGVGVLVPWNAFISAKSYFESRLCHEEEEGAAPVDKSIESTFAVTYNLASVLCLGLIIVVQWGQDQWKALHHHHHHHHHSHEGHHHHHHHHHHVGVVSSMNEATPHLTSGPCSSVTAAAAASAEQMSMSCSSSHSNSSSSGHAFFLVMMPLTMYVAVFLGQTIMVLAIDIPPDIFRTLTLVSLIVCGICGALAQAGIVATASLFPTSIGINPHLAGQSVGGLGVSLLNFMAAVVEDPSMYYKMHCGETNPQQQQQQQPQTYEQSWIRDVAAGLDATATTDGLDQAEETCVPYTRKDAAVFSYFFAGSIVLVLCLLGYSYIDRYQHGRHRDDYETVHDPLADQDHASSSSNHGILPTIDQSPRIGLEMNGSTHGYTDDTPISNNDNNNNDVTTGMPRPPLTDQLKNHDAVSNSDDEEPRFEDEPHNDEDDDAASGSWTSSTIEINETQEVWAIVKKPASSIFLVFFVTLGFFPGWVSELRSAQQCQSHSRLHNDLYTPAAFVLFNSGDLVGRLLSAQLPLSRIRNLSNKLVVGAMLRFIFFPLFFLCVGGSKSGDDGSAVIHSDLYSLTIQTIFSITNGLILTTAFAHTPSLLSNVTHVQERSSEILNFAVYFGLLMGSLVSVPIVQLFD